MVSLSALLYQWWWNCVGNCGLWWCQWRRHLRILFLAHGYWQIDADTIVSQQKCKGLQNRTSKQVDGQWILHLTSGWPNWNASSQVQWLKRSCCQQHCAWRLQGGCQRGVFGDPHGILDVLHGDLQMHMGKTLITFVYCIKLEITLTFTKWKVVFSEIPTSAIGLQMKTISRLRMEVTSTSKTIIFNL